MIKSINLHCKECLQNKHSMVASLCASRFECCRYRVVLGMLRVCVCFEWRVQCFSVSVLSTQNAVTGGQCSCVCVLSDVLSSVADIELSETATLPSRPPLFALKPSPLPQIRDLWLLFTFYLFCLQEDHDKASEEVCRHKLKYMPYFVYIVWFIDDHCQKQWRVLCAINAFSTSFLIYTSM